MISGLDAAAMVHRDLLNDGQAETTATAVGSGPGGIAPIKTLKHIAEIAFAQPWPVISDREQPPSAAGNNVDFHGAAIG